MDSNISVNSTFQAFKELVDTKFHLYNSLFTSLPFDPVEKTGVFLSLFSLHSHDWIKNKRDPRDMIRSFFTQYTTYTKPRQQIDLLFRFIQYSERQVVLFDALEDAAFSKTHDMQGGGTLRHLQYEMSRARNQKEFSAKIKDFTVRLVLTAHPTQFYPGKVLAIINDLSKALEKGHTAQVDMYLQQLGKTPFLKRNKPTPYDEAINLIWYLENVFYQAAGRIISQLRRRFPRVFPLEYNAPLCMGFWPGGDRDGNPFVRADTTYKVAQALQRSIISCYYKEVREIKRRLTFPYVEEQIAELELKLYHQLFVLKSIPPGFEKELCDLLSDIRTTLIDQHDGLFVELVEELIVKIRWFGIYFASIDIRQDSSIHTDLIETLALHADILPVNYRELSETEKMTVLLKVNDFVKPELLQDDLHRDTLETIHVIRRIQKAGGQRACHRYIISHTTSALNVLEVYALFLMSNWKPDEITVDIIPLFETIDDLKHASLVMKTLYQNHMYREHIKRRDDKQTIMLGFSDGTKDGGYLMANWSIYKAKEALTKISKEYDVEVIFFDGRGGPPSRGGGKTHQFYASMGQSIANKEIQLTVQGQTISSNFGTIDAAQYNIEHLMHAGMIDALRPSPQQLLSGDFKKLFQDLADESYRAFCDLKEHPLFIDYLNEISPLRYYSAANIGSRPSKRDISAALNLDNLRAVPYVGAWSQIKQNVPGFYGVGIALEALDKAGRWKEVRQLYRYSLYFRTLMDNCEMSMKKSCFSLTSYLSNHPKYGEIWHKIHDEFLRTRKYVLRVSETEKLMTNNPVDRQSIRIRERIVLPLLSIQQYALATLREESLSEEEKKIHEKLVVRCSFGIINAGRNSA